MNYLSRNLGTVEAGRTVQVNLSHPNANVMLLDPVNLDKYLQGQPFDFYGGYATSSVAYVVVPFNGHWTLVVDLGGAPGTIAATYRADINDALDVLDEAIEVVRIHGPIRGANYTVLDNYLDDETRNTISKDDRRSTWEKALMARRAMLMGRYAGPPIATAIETFRRTVRDLAAIVTIAMQDDGSMSPAQSGVLRRFSDQLSLMLSDPTIETLRHHAETLRLAYANDFITSPLGGGDKINDTIAACAVALSALRNDDRAVCTD